MVWKSSEKRVHSALYRECGFLIHPNVPSRCPKVCRRNSVTGGHDLYFWSKPVFSKPSRKGGLSSILQNDHASHRIRFMTLQIASGNGLESMVGCVCSCSHRGEMQAENYSA